MSLDNEARNIENAYKSNYQSGQNSAYARAASSIKELGFGIITNSAADLLAYNVMANVTLKSQVRKADRQYEKDLKELHNVTFGPYEKQLLSLMFEQYIPTARKCIAMWVTEVTEKLVDYEVRCRKNVAFAEISKYSLKESQVITDSINLKAVDDSECRELLLKAFKKCPYNEAIYVKAIEAGMLDLDSFEYGGVISGNIRQYEENMKAAAKKYCSQNYDDIDLVKKQSSFMVKPFLDNEKEVLDEIYKPLILKVTNKYKTLNFPSRYF